MPFPHRVKRGGKGRKRLINDFEWAEEKGCERPRPGPGPKKMPSNRGHQSEWKWSLLFPPLRREREKMGRLYPYINRPGWGGLFPPDFFFVRGVEFLSLFAHPPCIPEKRSPFEANFFFALRRVFVSDFLFLHYYKAKGKQEIVGERGCTEF